jgi:hypothetical protein
LSEILAPSANPASATPTKFLSRLRTPVTQRRDLWLPGEHNLLRGDSTSINDVPRVMSGKKADLCQPTPPYGVEYKGKTKDALQIRNDDEAGLASLLDASLGHVMARVVVAASMNPGLRNHG